MDESTARAKIYKVIFGTDTAAGQRFDVVLIYLIVISVLAVVFDSIEYVHHRFGVWVLGLGGFYFAVFPEYLLRIYSSPGD